MTTPFIIWLATAAVVWAACGIGSYKYARRDTIRRGFGWSNRDMVGTLAICLLFGPPAAGFSVVHWLGWLEPTPYREPKRDDPSWWNRPAKR